MFQDALAEGQDLFLSTHSVRFWASVAAHPALRNRPGVVFELFNEPHDGTLPTAPTAASAAAAAAAAGVAAGTGHGHLQRQAALSVSPGLRTTQSPSPDPNCSTGILNMHSCCPKSCGVCGGPKCGGHPCSGALPCYQQCCEGSAAIRNRSCDLLGPPCHLGPGPHPHPHPGPPGPPTKKAIITSACFLDGQ